MACTSCQESAVENGETNDQTLFVIGDQTITREDLELAVAILTLVVLLRVVF